MQSTNKENIMGKHLLKNLFEEEWNNVFYFYGKPTITFSNCDPLISNKALKGFNI